MKRIKIILAAFLFLALSLTTGSANNAKAENNANSLTNSVNNVEDIDSSNSQTIEYVDGHWYMVTYDDDGKMIDRTVLD